jgi:hypothetical protein
VNELLQLIINASLQTQFHHFKPKAEKSGQVMIASHLNFRIIIKIRLKAYVQGACFAEAATVGIKEIPKKGECAVGLGEPRPTRQDAVLISGKEAQNPPDCMLPSSSCRHACCSITYRIKNILP